MIRHGERRPRGIGRGCERITGRNTAATSAALTTSTEALNCLSRPAVVPLYTLPFQVHLDGSRIVPGAQATSWIYPLQRTSQTPAGLIAVQATAIAGCHPDSLQLPTDDVRAAASTANATLEFPQVCCSCDGTLGCYSFKCGSACQHVADGCRHLDPSC